MRVEHDRNERSGTLVLLLSMSGAHAADFQVSKYGALGDGKPIDTEWMPSRLEFI